MSLFKTLILLLFHFYFLIIISTDTAIKLFFILSVFIIYIVFNCCFFPVLPLIRFLFFSFLQLGFLDLNFFVVVKWVVCVRLEF